ncbi:MAG TPA: phage tail tape measure protein, partial [Ignavibacteriaceae bacterium]|nr:phage tail tape measure protein [Ignavibacteriaceae bacterium]
MAIEQIILDIRAQVDKAVKDIKKLETQVSGVNKQVKQTEKLFDKAAVALGTFFAAQKILQWGKEVGKTIMDFQQQVSGLSAITGAVGKDLEYMSSKAIELGVQLKKSAKDVVEAFQLVGSAQPELLKNAKALAEVTKQAIILSQAAKIQVSEAANIVTKSLNMWGVGAEKAAKFTDILADSQKKGTALIQKLGESLQNAGSIAAAVGMSFESTNAVLQAFAKGGIDGLKAGMAFNIVIRKLATSANDDFNPSYRSMTEVLENLAEKGYGDLKNATKLVGEEGARHLLTLVQQRDVVKQLEFNLGDAGIAMSQFETNTDNLRGAIDELKASFDALILSIESGEGPIASAAKAAVDLVSAALQMSTAKAKAAKETRKTLGPFFRYLFAGDASEKQEALDDARIGGMKIGLALGEGIVKIGKFLGVQEGFLGITEEAIKKLRGDIEISEEAEKAGESIGEDIVKGIKTGLESLSEEQFKALLDSVKMLGKVEEDEIDMGVIESALTAGKGYGEADSEARQNLDKAVERFDEKMRLMTHSLSTNNEDRLKIDQIYADAEIEIEKLKLSTKADLLTGALAVAGAALQDSAVASLLFSIAQSIASTY